MGQPLSVLRFISAATSFLGLGDNPGEGHGQMVDTFFREVGQPPSGAWDTAFVHHVGYWSQYNNEGEYSPWPLVRTASATDIAAFAHERRIVYGYPELGDIALVAGAQRDRIVRVGIVVVLRGGSTYPSGKEFFAVTTIEGNSGAGGRPGGPVVARVNRDLCPPRGDMFVRWAELDPRGAASRGDAGVELRAGRFVVRRVV